MNMRWKCPKCGSLNAITKHVLNCPYCDEPNPRWVCSCGYHNLTENPVCGFCGKVSPFHEEEKEVLEIHPPVTRYDIALKKKIDVNATLPPKERHVKIIKNDDHVIPFRRPTHGHPV